MTQVQPNINDTVAVVPRDSQNITKEKLRKFLPKGSSAQVTDEILEMIQNMENDTGLPQELLEEDVMSYIHMVGKVGGIGIYELVNAIKYCNLKRNRNNKDAWAIVFPRKHDELVAAGKTTDNFVSMYNNSKLVVAIDKEMMVPVIVQYSAYYHASIKKQFQLMNGDDGHGGNVSAMVMHLASKTLMETLKMPEDKSIELKIGLSDTAVAQQQEMNDALSQLVANQARMFASGMSADAIQKVHSIKVADGEVVVEAEIEEEFETLKLERAYSGDQE